MANTVPVLNKTGQKSGEVSLSAYLFGCEPNVPVMHQAVDAYLANQHTGTASKKTRSDVRGGGRKPWRQKGTGRARIGSIRVPHWTGGGVTFAPKPRDMGKNIPKKVKRLALRSALSSKAGEDRIRIVEDFDLPEVSTKRMDALLRAIGVGDEKTLLVIREGSRELFLSARNIPHLKVTLARELTTYDVLGAETIVMTQSALGTAEEVFGE
ncbi:MAG: 50S ribosomal protein L4 [Candidatus Eisenbacteria bacterium]|nr:50S ribosomal protein L4 [Candidatus Eisenbacteria bacterium]